MKERSSKKRLKLVSSIAEPLSLSGNPFAYWKALWQWPTAVSIFLLLLLFTPGRVMDIDVAIRSEVGHQIWTNGSVFVPKGNPLDESLVNVPGQSGGTSFYGIGQSLMLIPFDVVATIVHEVSDSDSFDRVKLRDALISLLYVPLIGVLWWFCTAWLIAGMGAEFNEARWASLAGIGLTSTFYYVTQSAQEEAAVGTLLMASLALTFYWAQHGRPASSWIFWAGLFFGFSVLLRLNAVLGIVPIAGVLLDHLWNSPSRRHRWRLAISWFGLGVVGPVSLQLLFAYLRFGNPLSTGYDLAVAQQLGVMWTSFQPTIFFGLVFGIGKGILILSPVLLLAFFGWRRFYTDYPAFSVSVALVWIFSCALCAHILNNPDGSESWACRYQVHLIPLLFVPAWFGAKKLWRNLVARGVVVFLVTTSALIQLSSTLAPLTTEYIQSDLDLEPRESLMQGTTTGQLFRRISNLSSILLGEEFYRPPTHDERTKILDHMGELYSPNFWPFAYSKKFPGSAPFLAFIALACAVSGILGMRVLLQEPEMRASESKKRARGGRLPTVDRARETSR